MCPWLPPSLIALISKDQWSARGSFVPGAKTFLIVGLLLAAFGTLWWLSRRMRPLERFSALFVPWMCLFPMAFFLLGISVVPQGNRYQLELELALCLATGCLCARVLEGPRYARVGLIALLAVLSVRQTAIFRHFARGLIRPVDISQTMEYKIARWIDAHMPGQRVMLSGDPQYLFNVLSNNPQFGGGHEPQVPNWMNLVAIYTIYTGTNAGDRDAAISVFWLKAFGVQAITVPGEKSREAYHPIARPHIFDGVLPVLWHDEDDTIFAVPRRSACLAHVIPKDAIVTRKPIHGLDLDPARAYVAALDDPGTPPALMTWKGNSRFLVQAPVQRNQAVSVQVTWAPGWEATANGRTIPVRGDGLGMIVIDPGCDGNCSIDVSYGVTREAWVCRLLSAAVTVGILVACAVGARKF
jgi:hypothetical protein